MDKKVFTKISYGLYIVSSYLGDKLAGQIANTVFQVSAEPPTFAVSINKKNFTYEAIQTSKVFAIAALSTATPMKYVGLFGFKSRREVDKYQTTKYKIGITGAPIPLDYTVAYLECELLASIDVCTHTIFVGKVVAAEMVNEDTPLTYDYYHRVIKGKEHENAPTYLKENKNQLSQEVKAMDKYRCIVCGYIYDPAKGDPESNIPANTPFESLPDDWACPICGVGKDQFEKV